MTNPMTTSDQEATPSTGSSSKERLSARITGRVQGVGFRQFVLSNAQRLGLRGYVRNLPDGTVECEAAGPEDRINRLEEHLRRGPSASRVDEVEVLNRNEAPAPDALPAGFDALG